MPVVPKWYPPNSHVCVGVRVGDLCHSHIHLTRVHVVAVLAVLGPLPSVRAVAGGRTALPAGPRVEVLLPQPLHGQHRGAPAGGLRRRRRDQRHEGRGVLPGPRLSCGVTAEVPQPVCRGRGHGVGVCRGGPGEKDHWAVHSLFSQLDAEGFFFRGSSSVPFFFVFLCLFCLLVFFVCDFSCFHASVTHMWTAFLMMNFHIFPRSGYTIESLIESREHLFEPLPPPKLQFSGRAGTTAYSSSASGR